MVFHDWLEIDKVLETMPRGSPGWNILYKCRVALEELTNRVKDLEYHYDLALECWANDMKYRNYDE